MFPTSRRGSSPGTSAATPPPTRPSRRGEPLDILVGYDVDTTTPEGRARLRKVALICKAYGQRVQFSLFECSVHQAQLEAMEAALLDIIDLQSDSLRIYTLAGGRDGATRCHGKDRYRDFDDPLIL